MNCMELLGIPMGVTSVSGSGGKTSLLAALAAVLEGPVILATTTHFMPFEGMPLVTSSDSDDVRCTLAEARVVCVAEPVDPVMSGGKLGASRIPIDTLAELAPHVIVEADGSRGLPLKAHARHEPVVPACAARRILVVGASGLGRPVSEVAHRPTLFCERTGCTPNEPASPELVAAELASELECGLIAPDVILVNQVDDETTLAKAKRLARELARQGHPLPAFAASLHHPRQWEQTLLQVS